MSKPNKNTIYIKERNRKPYNTLKNGWPTLRLFYTNSHPQDMEMDKK